MNIHNFFSMHRRRYSAAMGVIIAFALISCTTAAVPTSGSPVEIQPLPVTATPADFADLVTPPATVVIATQVVEVQAVATSRGPNLEATDPTTVSLAAGQLQLVEFFRFT